MAQEIIDPNTFNVENMSITPLKPMTGGGKMSFINYKKKGFYLQLPSVYLPQGLSCFTDEKTGKEQYSLQLNLSGYNQDGKMKKMYELLQSIDNYMIEQGVKNSKEWFGLAKNGKELSRDAIEEKYTPCTKFSKDKDTGDYAKDKNGDVYPPKFRLKLKQDDSGNFLFKNIINKKKESIGDRDLKEVFKPGTKITCLLKASMVWFTTAGYGISWKPEQIRIDEEGSQSIAPPAMRDDDEENSAPVPKTTGGASAAMVSDDEDELAGPVHKPSAVAAVMPSADSESDDDDEDTINAPPVPKKSTTLPPKKFVPKKK
jgi:hypothetical protein